MEKINYLFIPINFILKKFNYLFMYKEQAHFNIKTFEVDYKNISFELLKIEKIDNKFCKIIKKTILWQKEKQKV
jgi:hypothetical protein